MSNWTNKFPAALNSTSNMPSQTDGADTINSSTVESLRDAQIATEAILGVGGENVAAKVVVSDHLTSDIALGGSRQDILSIDVSVAAGDVLLVSFHGSQSYSSGNMQTTYELWLDGVSQRLWMARTVPVSGASNRNASMTALLTMAATKTVTVLVTADGYEASGGKLDGSVVGDRYDCVLSAVVL